MNIKKIEELTAFALDFLKARDFSKLEKKVIINKRGRKQTVYVRIQKHEPKEQGKMLSESEWKAERVKAYEKLDRLRDTLNAMKLGEKGRDMVKKKISDLISEMSRNGFFLTSYDDYANRYQKRQWILDRAKKKAAEDKGDILWLKPSDIKPVQDSRKKKKTVRKKRETGKKRETAKVVWLKPSDIKPVTGKLIDRPLYQLSTSENGKSATWTGEVKPNTMTYEEVYDANAKGDYIYTTIKPDMRDVEKDGKIRKNLSKYRNLIPPSNKAAKADYHVPLNYLGIEI